MNKQTIYFEKDGKIYAAKKGATIINVTDNKPAAVPVQDIVDRGNGRYSILLFGGSHEGWDESFEVEALDSLPEVGQDAQ